MSKATRPFQQKPCIEIRRLILLFYPLKSSITLSPVPQSFHTTTFHIEGIIYPWSIAVLGSAQHAILRFVQTENTLTMYFSHVLSTPNFGSAIQIQ